jgi:hypothetical protein
VAPPAPPPPSNAGSTAPADAPATGVTASEGGCAIAGAAPHAPTTSAGFTLAALALALGGLTRKRRRS